MSSDHQADTKLAQTIKDQYLNRVRVATMVRHASPNMTISQGLSVTLVGPKG